LIKYRGARAGNIDTSLIPYYSDVHSNQTIHIDPSGDRNPRTPPCCNSACILSCRRTVTLSSTYCSFDPARPERSTHAAIPHIPSGGQLTNSLIIAIKVLPRICCPAIRPATVRFETFGDLESRSRESKDIFTHVLTITTRGGLWRSVVKVVYTYFVDGAGVKKDGVTWRILGQSYGG
jgi:hypothetical protein